MESPHQRCIQAASEHFVVGSPVGEAIAIKLEVDVVEAFPLAAPIVIGIGGHLA